MTRDYLSRGLPSAHRVTAFTIRPELPPVEIRMTIGTFYRCLGKNFRYVARIAGHRFMHAPKRETGFRVVIELRLRPQGSPACLRVAVLAGDNDGPVRVADGLRRRRQAQAR